MTLGRLRGAVGRPPSRGPHRDDDAGLLVACAWCGRYRMRRGWTVVAPVPAGGRVSHGICPDCLLSVGVEETGTS